MRLHVNWTKGQARYYGLSKDIGAVVSAGRVLTRPVVLTLRTTSLPPQLGGGTSAEAHEGEGFGVVIAQYHHPEQGREADEAIREWFRGLVRERGEIAAEYQGGNLIE